MQEVSQKFRELWETPGKLTDVKFDINGVEYFNDAIYPSALSRRMFANDAPAVGSVVQGTFSSSVVLKSDIPKHATVKVYNRVVDPDNGETSEWIRRGEFYINSRKGYRAGSELEFTAKDAIGKTNKPYIAYTAFGAWPQNENAVVGEIAQIIGVTVDSRTVLLGYPVPYPNDYTMREILGYIAAANCGNWTITDNNELRLVPFGDVRYQQILLAADTDTAFAVGNTIIELFTDTYPIRIQKNVDSFSDLGVMDAYTGVRVWYTDQNCFEAGNDSGAVLECDCPWATQAMANAINSAISGYKVRAYSATYADVPPSAELGDVVRIDGENYQMLEYDVSLDGTHQPNIGAPAFDEAEEDYEPELQRQMKRTVRLGQNYYGTKIDADNGILIQLYDSEGQPTGAYAMFNASTLEYVKTDGTKAIYFDPSSGEYIFNGKLIIRNGMIAFGEGASLITVRYSTNKSAAIPSEWSTTWNNSWSNTRTEVWAIYSYDVGASWTAPVLIQGKDGVSPSLPDYIQWTYIDRAEIRSPTIRGNDIEAYNAFKVMNSGGTVRGYFGHGTGTGEGVMIAYGSSPNVGYYDDPYVICTEYGVRMSYAGASVYIDEETSGGSTDTVINLTTGSHTLRIDSTGIYADGNKLS